MLKGQSGLRIGRCPLITNSLRIKCPENGFFKRYSRRCRFSIALGCQTRDGASRDLNSKVRCLVRNCSLTTLAIKIILCCQYGHYRILILHRSATHWYHKYSYNTSTGLITKYSMKKCVFSAKINHQHHNDNKNKYVIKKRVTKDASRTERLMGTLHIHN